MGDRKQGRNEAVEIREGPQALAAGPQSIPASYLLSPISLYL